MRGFRSVGRATIPRPGIHAWCSAAWSELIDQVIGNLEPEIRDGAAALADIADRARKAQLLERDWMHAKEGSGIRLGITPEEREAVILRDLPA